MLAQAVRLVALLLAMCTADDKEGELGWGRPVPSTGNCVGYCYVFQGEVSK
jgi:hypothetical protein